MINYTPEVTQAIVEAYQAEPTMETVQALADKHDKTIKSVIGKLSREGVYKKATYKTKTGEKPVTKLELVAQIADFLEFDNPEVVAGLDKAPKSALNAILEKVSQQ